MHIQLTILRKCRFRSSTGFVRAGGLESGLDLKSGLKSDFFGLGLGLGLELSGLGLGLGLGLSGLGLWLGLEVESIKSILFLNHSIFF